MKAIDHFRTITHHRLLVMKGCFAVGLYYQGLMHDLSKYSPQEFISGCKYYQGNRSPNAAEREIKGYSAAWLHHKGRNKHHHEYWVDIDKTKDYALTGIRMPVRYVIEMFMDRIAASSTYKKEAYTDRSPLEYYELEKEHILLHERTRSQLEFLLNMLARDGEEKTFRYIREVILKKRPLKRQPTITGRP